MTSLVSRDRVRSLIIVLVSIGITTILLSFSPLELSGGVSNLGGLLTLIILGFLPLSALKALRAYRISSQISNLESRPVGDLENGLNLGIGRLNSRKSFKGPISGNNSVFLRVLINYFGFWTIFTRDIREQGELSLAGNETRIPLHIGEKCKIELPGIDEEKDYVSGFGSGGQDIEAFEDKHSLGLSFFRRNYIEQGISNGTKLTVVGELQSNQSRVELTDSNSVPLIISSMNPGELRDHYRGRVKKMTGLVLGLVVATFIGLIITI